MNNLKIGNVLDRKPTSTFIVCKDKKTKSSVKSIVECKFSFPIETSEYNLSIEEREFIENLLKTDPKEAIKLMLEAQIKEERIISYSRGTSSLLPSKFQRFYNRAVSFETEERKIYFADNSLDRFKEFIEKLKMRNKEDTVSYALDKIKSKEAQHIAIFLNEKISHDVRSIYLDNDSDYISLGPKNALYYSDNIGIDFKSVEKMINAFIETYGLFDYIKWNSTECVAYNENSLKISGLEHNPELLQKVLTYQKGGK